MVTVIIGILSAMGLPMYESQKDKSLDAWANAIIANATKILMADEFTSQGGVNFSDLDNDFSYLGTIDPVTVLDVTTRLDNQDYILQTDNRGLCFLYGYESTAQQHDDMLIVAEKVAESGVGAIGFNFNGTDDAKTNAANITAISCEPGSEGVTGGDWSDYQWLNLIP